MLKVQFQSVVMVLTGVLLAINIGVAESAERSRPTRRTAGPVSEKLEGSQRTLRHDTGSSQPLGTPFQFPVGVILDNADGNDWTELISAYDRSDVPSIVGPIEVVSEFSVTVGKSNDMHRMAPETPNEGHLEAGTTINLVGGLVLDPGEAVYLGDMIDDGLIVNAGETAFVIRLANGSEVALSPTFSLAVVPTRGATCCMMCTFCEMATTIFGDFYCLACEACHAVGLPRERDRARIPSGNPCLED